MLLSSPVEITPRLLPGVRIGGAFISIEYARRAGNDGRTRYQWYIDLPEGEYSGDDLQSGCGRHGLQSGLESLLSFLSACGESFAYQERYGRESENADLFPRAIAEWASANSDELSYLELVLSENPELIEE